MFRGCALRRSQAAASPAETLARADELELPDIAMPPLRARLPQPASDFASFSKDCFQPVSACGAIMSL
jgi:hypothetical protein